MQINSQILWLSKHLGYNAKKTTKDMDMCKLFILLVSLFYTCIIQAGSSYQIDLILFAHPQNASKPNDLVQNAALIPTSTNTISLKSVGQGSNGAYQLLKASQSSLTDEYYQLNHKSRYQVLAHYSWKQPANNQSRIALPSINTKGWQMQGTLRVRQSNYYLLDTELQFSPPNNPQSAFTVEQKQRLKNGVVYYLDHPQIGMLVKIH